MQIFICATKILSSFSVTNFVSIRGSRVSSKHNSEYKEKSRLPSFGCLPTHKKDTFTTHVMPEKADNFLLLHDIQNAQVIVLSE
jgi:hypothetical protein